jgi:hypothetical protein
LDELLVKALADLLMGDGVHLEKSKKIINDCRKNGRNPRCSFAGNLFESQMCRLSMYVLAYLLRLSRKEKNEVY